MWFLGKSSAMGVVETALKGRGWKYTRMDEQTIVTGVGLHPGANFLIVVRHEAKGKTLLFLVNPVKGAADVLQAIGAGRPPFMQVHTAAGHSREQVTGACELLMGQNYKLLLGGFERDPVDGEIRFRIALPYRDASPTAEQVNWCIEAAVASLMMTLPRLEAYLGGKASLEDAMGGGAPGPMVV